MQSPIIMSLEPPVRSMKMYNMTRPANEFMLVLPTVPSRSAEYLDANYELERADEGPLKQAYVVSREDCADLPKDCSFMFWSIRKDCSLGSFISDFWDGNITPSDIRYESLFRQ